MPEKSNTHLLLRLEYIKKWRRLAKWIQIRELTWLKINGESGNTQSVVSRRGNHLALFLVYYGLLFFTAYSWTLWESHKQMRK